MAEIISNEKIQAFIEERKYIHDQWRDAFITRWNGNSKERILEIVGDAEHKFRIIVRENKFNPSRNFSVVLGVYYPTPNKIFRLLRMVVITVTWGIFVMNVIFIAQQRSIRTLKNEKILMPKKPFAIKMYFVPLSV